MVISAHLRGKLATAILLLSFFGLCRASAGNAVTNSYFYPLRANQLMGLVIENSDGEELGSLRDLAVDTRTGQLEYVIVASGGFLGVGTKLRAVPAQLVSAATAKRDTLALNVPKARWETAPTFKPSELAQLNEPHRARAINQFFESSFSSLPATAGEGRNLSPTGREAAPPASAARPSGLKLTSDLVGQGVINREQEKFGEILDLLVIFSSHSPVFVIFSGGRPAKGRDYDYAMPLNAARVTDEGKLMIDANAAVIQQTQLLNRRAWEAAEQGRSPIIYRYPKKNPGTDNTRRNVRDRQSGALTPFDQSSAEMDIRVTRQIRQAVVRQDFLSFTARNVKIITRDGKVTLRGPVLDEHERISIVSLAETAVGDGKVDDQLEPRRH